jgi:hypothetical protein
MTRRPDGIASGARAAGVLETAALAEAARSAIERTTGEPDRTAGSELARARPRGGVESLSVLARTVVEPEAPLEAFVGRELAVGRPERARAVRARARSTRSAAASATYELGVTVW